MAKTTLAPMWLPLMSGPTIKLDYCPICGRTTPLEQHHPVYRSAGKLIDPQGKEIKKPTITLCGFGNNLMDADGRYYCHGLAHNKRLWFNWIDNSEKWVYLLINDSEYDRWHRLHPYVKLDFLAALSMDGWRDLL